jgi:hypothetical protein
MMPTIRIPLVGSFNQRALDGSVALGLSEDQRFKNVVFSVVTNPVTGKSTVYCEKRPGWVTDSLVENGSASTQLCKPQSFNGVLSAFGETNSTIYFGTTSVGVITGRALHMTETLISQVGCVAIKSSDGTGWYYMAGAKDQLSYTGDTHTNTTIDNIASTAGMYVGQKISGTNIVAGTRIATVSSTSITVDTATTGTTAGVTITKEPIAKIIDADFVTTTTSYVGAFAPLDGYLFYPTEDGYINNSDLNSVSSYTANARRAVQQAPDPSVAVAVQKSHVVVFGTGSNEKFQNAGFTTAPLQVLKTQVEHIGTLDQRSVTAIEDDIYYVATPYEGDVGVYRMRGLQSVRVSTPTIDKIIGTAASGGSIYANSFRLAGQAYAGFFISMASDLVSKFLLESGDYLLLESGDKLLLEGTAGQGASFIRYLVYNINLNTWAEWDCNHPTFVDSVGSGTANKIICTSRVNTSGKVYRIDPVADGNIYRDDGVGYTMEVRTAKLDLGTGKRKFIEEIELLGTDIQAGNSPYLSFSDDDYQTWSTPRLFDTSGPRPRLTRIGSHKGGRAYKITDESNAPFRAEALAITYSVAS